jgi:hypothetical protein
LMMASSVFFSLSPHVNLWFCVIFLAISWISSFHGQLVEACHVYPQVDQIKVLLIIVPPCVLILLQLLFLGCRATISLTVTSYFSLSLFSKLLGFQKHFSS